MNGRYTSDGNPNGGYSSDQSNSGYTSSNQGSGYSSGPSTSQPTTVTGYNGGYTSSNQGGYGGYSSGSSPGTTTVSHSHHSMFGAPHYHQHSVQQHHHQVDDFDPCCKML